MANSLRDERERLTVAALFEAQERETAEERRRTTATVDALLGDRRIEASPVSLREKIGVAVDVGQYQVVGDKERFLATNNLIFGRDKEAKSRLAKAELADQRASELSQNLIPFQDFLDAPTFDGFVEQAVTLTAKFIPNMGLSIASAMGTGGASVAGKFAINQTSKQFAKQMTKEIAQKKMAGEALDEASLAAEANLIDGDLMGADKFEFVLVNPKGVKV